MKHRINVLLSILVTVILVTGASSGVATQQPTVSPDANHTQTQSEKTFNVDNFNLKIPTAQVPFYEFWQDNGTQYRVQFDQLFEVNDSNDNGQFDQGNDSRIMQSSEALSSWTWEMSEVENETDALHFNLTGMMGDQRVQFRNHLEEAGNDTNLKFDVVIQNYEWTSDSDNTLLTLAYKLQTGGRDYTNQTRQRGNNSAQFGNAYFNATSTANTTSGSEVSSMVSTGSGTPNNANDKAGRVYLSYEKFSGNMTHDPTLGITTSASVDDSGEGILNFYILPGALALLVAIPLLRKKLR